MMERPGKYGACIDIRDPHDEFMVEGNFHFEAMGDDQWYASVLTPDGYTMLIYFTAVKKGLQKAKLEVSIVEVKVP